MTHDLYASLGDPVVTLFASVFTVMVAVWFLVSGPVGVLRRVTGRAVPEAKPWYGPATLVDFIATSDASGAADVRVIYRRQLRWDIPFALLYGSGLTLILAGTFLQLIPAMSTARFLIWAPLLGSLFDIGEDVLLLAAVGPNPNGDDLRRPKLVPVALAFTIAKVVFAWGSAVLAVVSLIWLGVSGYR